MAAPLLSPLFMANFPPIGALASKFGVFRPLFLWPSISRWLPFGFPAWGCRLECLRCWVRTPIYCFELASAAPHLHRSRLRWHRHRSSSAQLPCLVDSSQLFTNQNPKFIKNLVNIFQEFTAPISATSRSSFRTPAVARVPPPWWLLPTALSLALGRFSFLFACFIRLLVLLLFLKPILPFCLIAGFQRDEDAIAVVVPESSPLIVNDLAPPALTVATVWLQRREKSPLFRERKVRFMNEYGLSL